ncbi:DUF4013 domain-containing protein [Halobacterium sp. R2-5]|uniref:DUF4013 domain-containing protein n=1 Tax=Halobacterium sp. R2-5 TaxID=2715751 RepID=UPI0014207C1C|nr:DUF4013 domain-containing protein [Halobacterium sp. R2-5]NIB99528.1 DUF4013 domain-containing protein [Halobacterium sp. R2-5]
MVPAPLSYPFRGERRVDALLAGGGLHLLSVYVPVVPLVVALGYLLVVFGETASRGSDDRYDVLPAFADVRRIVRTGVGGATVVAAFLLPAAVVLVVTVAGVSQLSLSPGDVTIGTSVGFVLGSTTSLLLAVAFFYLLPAALANYLATGQLRGAVDVDVLTRAATHAAYFYDVTVGLVAGGLLLVVAGFTTAIAVGFFVAFYAELVAVAFWARGVSRALPDVAGDL